MTCSPGRENLEVNSGLLVTDEHRRVHDPVSAFFANLVATRVFRGSLLGSRLSIMRKTLIDDGF
jgi:hypothetical protein